MEQATLPFEKTDIHLAEVELVYKTKIKIKDRVKINDCESGQQYCRALFSEDSIEHIEKFYIVLLNRNNQVLGWKKISQGGVNGTIADPKVILQAAIISNASAIILTHNHPSGATKPSHADVALTQKIKQASLLHDINVIDHIIITEDSFYSFANEGNL